MSIKPSAKRAWHPWRWSAALACLLAVPFGAVAQDPVVTRSITVNGTTYDIAVFNDSFANLNSAPPEGYLALDQTSWWDSFGTVAEDLAFASSGVSGEPIRFAHKLRPDGQDVTFYTDNAQASSETSNYRSITEVARYATQAVPEIDGAALAQAGLALGAFGLWMTARRRRGEGGAIAGE
ncbi:hypothetical protein V6X63_10285 [Spiribacter sp. 221]|uniref:hypothetical protein n=1 Tax=Spiribacter onubensis TaxID=3122420 RepID=UPI00349FC6BE